MTKRQNAAHSRWKLVLGGLLISILVFFLFVLDASELKKKVTEVITWIHSLGMVAPFILWIIHTIAVVICFPGTIFFEIGAGILFGFWGIPLVSISKTCGACISFVLGKTLLHDWIHSKLKDNQKFQNLYRNVGKDSLRVAFLLRISPVPSWVNNYGLSLTSISFPPFICATILGSLPMIIQQVYMGTLISNVAHLDSNEPSTSNSWFKNISLALGLLATFFISKLLVKYATNNEDDKEEDFKIR
eukprot:TRINITY_DN8966_c0_g1_i1.p1 TRINITY_DN8966_c0_g1~~TRINITY_DN8966_c0_g1_i1.p1  ORF type:complete len:245 (+),score=54.88 TRINITY_DN8966_c0_g1_i1:143-877(+)